MVANARPADPGSTAARQMLTADMMSDSTRFADFDKDGVWL